MSVGDPGSSSLLLRRAGIDTYQQPVVYMHRDCAVCRAEGFAALTRIEVRVGERSLVATLNVVVDDWLPPHEAALSEAAWSRLRPQPGARARFAHPEPARSAGALRRKVFGGRLDDEDYRTLIADIVGDRLSELELAAFVTACAGDRLDGGETISLTRAMLEAGERLDWGAGPVLDKHCVGGLPGNRTTPIVVAIVAALGHRIPKTSSRAITSPAGTADTMEVMAPVALDLPTMRRVVEHEGGCIVWGGKVRLSPADDVLIRVERPLDFDSDGQLVASVLSKKLAAGSSHVLIDIPIGATAKVRSDGAADALAQRLQATAEALELRLRVHRSDGRQPVGVGIGPVLEARDVLQVLRNEPAAPLDLRERALDIAGALLDMVGSEGRQRAEQTLASGAALTKFMAICAAQGGFREPQLASFRHAVVADRDGTVAEIDNRRLARVAKLAGAPLSVGAGVDCWSRIGDAVQRGQPLFTVYAASQGELNYALDYIAAQARIVALQEPIA